MSDEEDGDDRVSVLGHGFKAILAHQTLSTVLKELHQGGTITAIQAERLFQATRQVILVDAEGIGMTPWEDGDKELVKALLDTYNTANSSENATYEQDEVVISKKEIGKTKLDLSHVGVGGLGNMKLKELKLKTSKVENGKVIQLIK